MSLQQSTSNVNTFLNHTDYININAFPTKKDIDNYLFEKKFRELADVLRNEISQTIHENQANCLINLDDRYFTTDVIKKAKKIMTEKGYKIIDGESEYMWEIQIFG